MSRSESATCSSTTWWIDATAALRYTEVPPCGPLTRKGLRISPITSSAYPFPRTAWSITKMLVPTEAQPKSSVWLAMVAQLAIVITTGFQTTRIIALIPPAKEWITVVRYNHQLFEKAELALALPLIAIYMNWGSLKTDLNSQRLFAREDNAIFRLGFMLVATGWYSIVPCDTCPHLHATLSRRVNGDELLEHEIKDDNRLANILKFLFS